MQKNKNLMKDAIILIITICLTGFTCYAQSDDLKIPAEIKPFVEKGTKAIALESADLNGDNSKDYVLILEKEKPEKDKHDFPVKQRPLLIIVRDKKNKLSAVKRNENIVMCSECGGVMGDPFQGVEVGEKTFTVNHYGGSGIRWSARYKFNYSRIDKTWQLVEVKNESYSTADVDDIKSKILTPKDFGKIDVADFNPNDLNNLNAAQSDIKQNNKASTTENAVTFNSFGKVKTGMTVSQASKALGTELFGEAEDGIDCYYVNPKKGFTRVRFMVTNGSVARIEIESKAYATDRGAKIGDTEAKIKSLYKGVKVSPNKYDEKQHDMEVYSADKKYLIIFETDGRRVTAFRVGEAEEVGYVEGCS